MSRVVVVTGASRGIGREIAAAFAAQGDQVACVATRLESSGPVAEEIGGRAYACNVSQADSVAATFEQIAAEMGDPAVLVNNAGITHDTLILRMKDEDWDQVIAVNLKGAFLCSRAVMKAMMKARFGRLVNVSSIIGLTGAAGQANYAASKAGLIGLTKSIAKEVGSRGITCNAVAPGFIQTDMTADLPAEFREYVEKTAPIGRLGHPSDIAPAVLFLASDGAGYITGQTLTIDGGLTL